MAAVCGGSSGRQRRPAAVTDEDHHHQQQHDFMADPDLDVASIVTEFVPLDDPFVPYFDGASVEELENGELCAPLEASFASSIGEERMFARFRQPPAGCYPPTTSTPRFSLPAALADERVEVPRGRADGSSRCNLHDDTLAELMEAQGTDMIRCVGSGGSAGARRSPIPQLLAAELSPSGRYFHEPAPLSLVDQFMHSISRLVSDATFARTTRCFRSKIPREVSDEALISFLTHCVRYPMRRAANTLLQARCSALVLDQLLKAAMEPLAEAHEPTMTRQTYFRITLKNAVASLGHLYQIVRDVVLAHRGHVDVTYSPVRGRIAFVGYNGNLPIRMSQPIASFIEAERDARQQLNALFSAEITLLRADDDAREVYLTYYDAVQTHPRTGQQQRVTEVNVYHIIHPTQLPTAVTPATAIQQPPVQLQQQHAASSPPPPGLPYQMTSPPPPLASFRGGSVVFSNAPAKYHEVHVERPMYSLAHVKERTYTLPECFQLARSYPLYKW